MTARDNIPEFPAGDSVSSSPAGTPGRPAWAGRAARLPVSSCADTGGGAPVELSTPGAPGRRGPGGTGHSAGAAETAGPSPLRGGDGPVPISLFALASELELTEQQLRHWVKRGWLNPVRGPEAGVRGHGKSYLWPPGELVVARRMAALVISGFEAAPAAELARTRRRSVLLWGGVLVILPHVKGGGES